MIIFICAFTEKGSKVAEEIMAAMPSHIFEQRDKAENLSDWVGRGFILRAPIIFIGASGIAVRSIAPFVNSKLSDSPVIVIDEMKEFVIPLLSGHIGGANELARSLADLLGARPVISTATDVNDSFAVDVWAKEMGLVVYNKSGIAEISSEILKGKKVTLLDKTGLGEELTSLPENVEVIEKNTECLSDDKKSPADARADIIISEDYRDDENCSLLLIPKRICLGIGCRKGTELAAIEKQVALALSELADLYSCPLDNIYDCIYGVASIDLKAKEYGLNAFAQKIGTRLVTFSADELMSLQGDFTESEFVEQVTGVSNVCERAAVLLAKMSGGIQSADRQDPEGRLYVVSSGSEGRMHTDKVGSEGRLHAISSGSEGRLHATKSDSAGRLHTDKVGSEGRLHAASSGSEGRLHATKSDSAGRLLVRKIASDGVTVAIALK